MYYNNPDVNGLCYPRPFHFFQTSHDIVPLPPFSEKPIEELRAINNITSISFSPHGRNLAIGTLGEVEIWNIVAGIPIGEPQILPVYHEEDNTLAEITSISYSSDGTMLAAGSDRGYLRIWHIVEGRADTPPQIFQAAKNLYWITQVGSVSFSPDSTTLAAGLTDGNVRFYKIFEGSAFPEELFQATQGYHDVNSINFSPDGMTVAVGTNFGYINIFRLQEGRPIGDPHHIINARCVSFSASGTMLAAGGGQEQDGFEVAIWDLVEGQPIGNPQILPAEGRVTSIDFSLDGTMLAAGGYQENGGGFVQIWDLVQGHPVGEPQVLRTRNPVYVVSFNPDGTTLAAANGDDVQIWKKQRQRISPVKGPRKNYQ